MGNDLNSLLPVEYCYLADDALRAVFMERYAEKRLQLFDYQSKETEPVKDDKHKVSGQGPYIICVDTSGSMQGNREILSKSAILAIAQLTEKTHRKCYVINFSDEAVSLLIEDLGRDMPRLAEFLNKRFDGGTDIEPALREARISSTEMISRGIGYRIDLRFRDAAFIPRFNGTGKSD